MPAPRASFSVANHIAKAEEPFTVGEELILPAAKDICHELLGEAAVQKVACVPLLASTIIRLIDGTAEDTEAQLLERINESPWYPRSLQGRMATVFKSADKVAAFKAKLELWGNE